MILYHIASISKLVLGLFIIFLTYTSINVYEDPAVGIGLLFVGLFIAVWGASFYLFFWFQNIFRKIDNQDRILKDSYKLSLLFGIYVLINVMLILLGYRSRILGILLLLGFIGLQSILFKANQEHEQNGNE